MKHRSSLFIACTSLILSSALGCSQEVLIGAVSSDGSNGSGGGSNHPSATGGGSSDPNAADGGSNDPDAADGGPSVPLALCPLSTLASGTGSRSTLALHGDTLYWANTVGIKTLPLAGGVTNVITGGYLPESPDLAFDAKRVYWRDYWSDSDTGAVMAVPLGGGNPTVVTTSGFIGAFAVDTENLYWVDSIDVGVTRLMKAALTGGAPELVPASVDYISSFAVDDEAIYWTTYQGPSKPWAGTVMKLPKAGGPAFTIASGVKAPSHIVVYAESVYWAGYIGDVPAQDVIMKAPKSGGAPSVVAATRQPPAFAVNETGVYWVEYDYSTPPPGEGGGIHVIGSHFMRASLQGSTQGLTDVPFPGVDLAGPIACPGGACFLASTGDYGSATAAETVMRYGPCP